MSLRRRLTTGLGFLFLIIFALSMYSMIEINDYQRMQIES